MGDNIVVKALLDQIAMIDQGLDKNRILDVFSNLVVRVKSTAQKKAAINSLTDIIVKELKKIKEEEEFKILDNLPMSYTFDSSNVWNLTGMIWSSLSRSMLETYLEFNDQKQLVEVIRDIFFDLVQNEENIDRDMLKKIQFWNDQKFFGEIVTWGKGIMIEIDSLLGKRMNEENLYSIVLFEEDAEINYLNPEFLKGYVGKLKEKSPKDLIIIFQNKIEEEIKHLFTLENVLLIDSLGSKHVRHLAERLGIPTRSSILSLEFNSESNLVKINLKVFQNKTYLVFLRPDNKIDQINIFIRTTDTIIQKEFEICIVNALRDLIDCLQDPQVIIDKGNFTLKLALHLLNIFSKGDRNIFTCFLEVCLPVFIQKLLPSLQDYDQEENDPILKLINYLQDLITFKNVTNVTNWLTKVSSEIPNLINSLIFLPSERTESLILHTDKDTCKLYFDKSLFSSEAEVKKSSVLELLERKTDELIYSFLLFEFFNKLHVLSED